MKRRGDDSTTAINQHIRFGSDDESTHEATVHSSSNSPTRHNKQSSKRKRKHPSTTQKEDTASCNKLFNGLVVAISTLESKAADNTINDPYQNYKTLKQELQTLGATISPQVHKRVHYLISTDMAVQNLTQRVRQALKRNIDIVDVEWVKKCSEQKTRLDATDYLCNELAKKVNEGKCTHDDNKIDGDGGSDVPDEDNAGWSTPIHLDCCCVCHENGDDNCPWCADCNLTIARKAEGDPHNL
jgi:hypothetical protein